MIEAIGAGLLLGVGLTFITGPIFFALMQTSLTHGTFKAQILASGIWFSDLLYSFVLFYFSQQLDQKINWEATEIKYLSLMGGIVMAGMGIFLFINEKNKVGKLSLGSKNSVLFSKGFAINTFNPFTIFFWLSVITGSKIGKDYSQYETIALISSIIFVIILGDNLKIFFAGILGKWLNSNWKKRVEYLTGLIFIGFGAYLIYLFFIPPVQG